MAARMPSCSSKCSSVRSSCLVFVISLIALNMSTELTIGDSLRSPSECQPGVFDVGQRDTLFDTMCGADDHCFRTVQSFHAEDLDFRTALQGGAQHTRPLSHKPTPVGRLVQRPLDPRR